MPCTCISRETKEMQCYRNTLLVRVFYEKRLGTDPANSVQVSLLSLSHDVHSLAHREEALCIAPLVVPRKKELQKLHALCADKFLMQLHLIPFFSMHTCLQRHAKPLVSHIHILHPLSGSQGNECLNNIWTRPAMAPELTDRRIVDFPRHRVSFSCIETFY